jgi:membrane fusion protein, multidrug efflux system
MPRSTLIALAIAVAVAGWLASPHLGIDQWLGRNGEAPAAAGDAPADSAQQTNAERITAVRTRSSIAEPMAREVVLNGRTEAVRTVRLAAEVSGRVVELAVEKGQRVAAGDVVAQLDRRDREASVAEAEATLAQRTIEYQAASRLGERGFQAETQVAASRAALETARYHLRRAEIELEHTTIAAPFAGVVEERPVELGSFVDVGDTVMRLVDLDPILVVSDVPEASIPQITVGSPAEIRLVDDSRREGTVRFVAREANERTRTFRAEVAVDNPDGAIPAGLSTTLALTLEAVPAHRVSPGILVLDDRGLIGVNAVDADSRVVFHPADIVRAEAEAIWLAGLPDRLELITVGQGFVAPGQTVAATDEGQVAAQIGGGPQAPGLEPRGAP